MLAIFIRTDAATHPEIISTEFLRSVFANFGEKPILIIHHHSNPDLNLQHQTFLQSSFARHVGIVHCKDDGQTLPNGNSIFIRNFCRAFNSYDDFSGPVLFRRNSEVHVQIRVWTCHKTLMIIIRGHT